MGIHDEAEIILRNPEDKIEYVAHVLLKSYRSEARTWYDLARAAVAAIEKYDSHL